MLLKKNRLEKKAVDEIFKHGRVLNTGSLTFKYISGSSLRRISFIAPKGLAKTAARRNSLRRQGYLALERHWERVPQGIAGVFIFKVSKLSPTLEDEIEKILSKI